LDKEPGGEPMNMHEKRAVPALTLGELESFLRTEFPQAFNGTSGLSVEEIWHGGARLRQAYREAFIRPGGTISGPTMMALADVAIYVAINFLRRPAAADLVAEAELMKLGKRLAVGQVAIRSAGEAEMVAHATSTYSIPRPQDG
jgi:acyl-coenzyme A thioesterase PaaI-like protein